MKTFVTRVAGNVKGDFEYPLSPCTLVVGRNASGKSRAADALALAMTGRAVSDGLGKREVDLLALAPPGSEGMFAEITLSDGTSARWSCKGSTAKASRPEWSGECGALIMGEAIALLRSDAAHLRAALLARMGGSIETAKLRERFPASLWPRWAVGYGDVDSWTVDMVMEAADAVNERLKKVRAQKKLVEAKLAEGLSVEALSDEEVTELDELSAAAAKQGYSADEIARLREQQENLERALIEASAEADARDADVKASSGVAPTTVRLIDLSRDLITVTLGILDGAQRSSGKCPVCGTHASYDALTGRLTEVQALSEQIRNAQASSQALVNAYHLAKNRMVSVESQLAQTKRTLSQATLAIPVDRERLSALQERLALSRAYVEARDALGKLSLEEGELDTLKKLSADVISALLDSKVEELAQRVTAALPKSMSAEIALRDGNRKVCRVALRVSPHGVARDFRALSGAERAILVSAFAAALLADYSGGVRAILIDDVWFDPETLRALMDSLGRAVRSENGPSQVIINAVTWHGRMKLPEGWTMVKVDDVGCKTEEVPNEL